MKTPCLNKFIMFLATLFVIGTPVYPVLADDTEIYIGANAGASVVKPNVLFIVDTSGSMNDNVTTTIPYDPATTYAGSCVSGQIYWTSKKAPTCSSSQYFATSSNNCNDSLTALSTSGFYTGTLARYSVSSKNGKDTSAWASLTNSDHTSKVECSKDYGNNGDISGANPTKVYPGNAANGPWTATKANSISWNGTGGSYTLYTANYLNYKYGAGSITKTKMDIVKETFASVLSSTSGINVGLMRFSSDAQGGYFLAPMQELNSTNLPGFITAVNSLSPNGGTPLAETLYEASLYFKGAKVKYGAISSPAHNVSTVLDSSDNTKYKSPMEYQCQKNFVVYMTDGDPTSDNDADTLIKGLPSFKAITGGSVCTGVSGGSGADCLAEMAQWMYKSDLNSTLNDTQNVSTFTIGVAINNTLLLDTASKGGGKFYPTTGSNVDMTDAFNSILTNILAVNTTFIAPAVTVNAFNRLNNRDDLFYAVFKPAGSPIWPGNIKHYKLAGNPAIIVDANNAAAIDANTGFFSGSSTSLWTLAADAPDGDDVTKGGAAGLLTTSRHLYTYVGAAVPNNVSLTATGNNFDETNSALDYTVLGISSNDADYAPSTASAYRTSLLKYSRGVDVFDENQNGSTTDSRRAMGDILHSKPLLMTYGGTDANPDLTLFASTNDGFIHAFNAVSGAEQFAFIPKELLPNLDILYNNYVTDKHPYGMDGPLSLWHKDLNKNGVLLNSSNIVETGEHVYLYAGMRRGGNHYYALDASDRANPVLKWQIDGGAGDFAELGQTWSRPIVTKIKLNGTAHDVLIFGGGYDTTQDSNGAHLDDTIGHAIYMVDAETGARLWWASSTNTANLVLPSMTNSIPSDVRVLDMNLDGYADRLYVGDMGGRIWRIDFDNVSNTGAANLATGGIFANLSGSGVAGNRRFYYAPDVALVKGTSGYMLTISIGSGYRAHPLDTAIHDRFYSIHDNDVYAPPAAYPAYTEASLYDATANDLGQATGATLTAAKASFSSAQGWYIKLQKTDGTYEGEKVLASSLTLDGVITFTTFTPVASAQATACAPSQGTAKAYSVNLADATPAYDLVPDGNSYTRDDRARTLTRGGIPPEPTVIFLPDQQVPLCGTEVCSDQKPRRKAKKAAWQQVE